MTFILRFRVGIFSDYRAVSISIHIAGRAIVTICEQVLIADKLRIKHPIRINKPPDLGIIIPALQVIEPGLGVVVVAAVAQGVQIGDMRCGRDRGAARICHGEELAPGVVGVIRHDRAAGIQERYHVTLQVQQVVVQGRGRRPSVDRDRIFHRKRPLLRIVEEIHLAYGGRT